MFNYSSIFILFQKSGYIIVNFLSSQIFLSLTFIISFSLSTYRSLVIIIFTYGLFWKLWTASSFTTLFLTETLGYLLLGFMRNVFLTKSSRIIFRELNIYFWGINLGSCFSSISKSFILSMEVSFNMLLKNYLG